MRKIRWTTKEMRRVAAEVDRLRSEDPHFASLSLMDQLQKAQEVLPPERQRLLRHSTAWSLISMFPGLAQSSAPHHTPPREESPPRPLDALLEDLCKTVADTLAKQLEQALRHRMAAVVERGRQLVVEEGTKRLKRVVLLGPLDGQFAQLRREFEGLLDLRSSETYKGASRASEAVSSADVVLVWVDFVAHSSYSSLPREKVVLVRGGMTKVREKLEEIYLAS